MDESVYAAFEAYPDDVRDRLLDLRELVLDVADKTQNVGRLEETLKWGEVSYLNPAGTTLRIGVVKGSSRLAIFVHCQTSIVEALKADAEVLEFEGTRCIKLPVSGDLDQPEIRDCIRRILTYRL